MRTRSAGPAVLASMVFVTAMALVLPSRALAQDPAQGRLELYGFAMLDMGYQTKVSDPDWFDVLRPTKLPGSQAEKDSFGEDGHTYAGVRQSRLGVKGFIPTSKGEIKTIFEFELFGVGPDAGQTTFRLRHAYGEFGHWGAGQTWSPFMDIDVFPNSIEYWGPNGMVFFRNVQIRYQPLQGRNQVSIALERPGASGDTGVLVSDPDDIGALVGHFPLPDLSGHYRMTRDWGHVQVAGILRRMEWDDTDPIAPDFSGSATGWGINLSSNLKFDRDTLRWSVVVGEGISNYMNDATADVGAVTGPDIGEALPLTGVSVFYDRTWNDRWTSTWGYSMVDIDNSNAQAPDAYRKGQYALANLLYSPVKGLMWGGEVQWGDRENFSNGFSSDDLRFQVSVKYNFSHSWGG